MTSTQKTSKHIYCSTGMTQKMHDVFVGFVLSQQDVSEYVVYLASSGGNPLIGFNLYSFMKARPEETTVFNMSSVDSAAVQFFLGFKNRHSAPIGTFMVHPTTFSRDVLPQHYNQFDARRALNELESVELKTEKIILTETIDRAKTPLTEQQVKGAMFQTTVLRADQALDFGIIDSIVEPILPSSDVLYLTDASLASM